MSDLNNSRYFLRKLARDEIGRLIYFLNTENVECTVWNYGSDEKFEIHFFNTVNRDLFFLKPPAPMHPELLKCLGHSEALLKLKFKDKQFFLKGRLRETEDNQFFYKPDWSESYESVQRKDCRVLGDDYFHLFFEVNGKSYEGRDLSLGGTAFYIEKSEKDKFKVGELIRDASLRANTDVFIVPEAKVMSCRKAENPGKTHLLQIGLQFQDLPKSVESKIWKIVNREMKKVFLFGKEQEDKKAS